jgi:hypothetical protein
MSRRRALLAITVIVVAVVVGVLVWPWVRIYTNAAPPDQFYAPLSPPALSGRSVLAVAQQRRQQRCHDGRGVALRR